jgi:tripartite-type tricarboxylate transporter receptor subunit TctC
MISQLARAAGVFLLLAASAAHSQGYPVKPIRIVVPFAPGGNVDITARLVAPALAEALGQPVLVENKPGAGGTIGADQVAKAPADGYTLLMGSNSSFSVAPSLYSKIAYNPLKDFAPVIMIASAPFVLVTNPGIAAKSARDLVAQAKAAPRKLTMSSAGTGSSNHLVGELFQEISGARFTHVPYKGSGQALTDLMGGQVDLHFDQITSAASHIQGGKLRALMVTARERVPMLPDVPTAAEAGYAAFEATNVTGLIAPAGTPRDIIDKLNAATQKAIEQTALREKFAGIGAQATGGTPEQFAAYIRDDLSKWTRIVKDANVKVD